MIAERTSGGDLRVSPSPKQPSATNGPPSPSGVRLAGDSPSPSRGAWRGPAVQRPIADSPAPRQAAARRPRERAFGLVFALYAATLSTDVIRKLADFPNSISAIVYVLTGLIYFFLLPKALSRGRVPPRPLPVWLVLLSLWCATEAIVHRIPVGIALLGWVSYVFFVPLFYIGAELMADDRHAATALRVAALAGGIVGLGAITSAVLGQAAPASLQPIVPSVGIHSFSAGNVYLAPSIFATAEEASEQLLIALFAWAALTQLPSGRLGRMSSVLLGVLIAVGLFATARRADIFVAVSGIVALVCFGFVRHSSSTGQPDPWAVRARRRLGTALILAAIGSVALLSFLGASKLVPFLTSGSA